MDWESEKNEEVSEKKDTSKRIWYIIFIVIVVMFGVLYAQEESKTIKRPIGVHVRHIVSSPRLNDSLTREDALKRIKEVKRQLDEGANFSELVLKYSDDPNTKFSGGDLGWYSEGELSDAFENYIWKGPVGVYSDPIETKTGFHIVYIIERNLSDAQKYQREIYQRLHELNKQEQ